MKKVSCLLIFLWISSIQCWEALPQIPTGRRSQYLVLHESGGYKYGYDTGDGSAAEQSGDDSNQVEGRYLYLSPLGQKINLKYTAGVQGFVPEGLPSVSAPIPEAPVAPQITQYSSPHEDNGDQAGTGDASYSFNVDTDSYKRQETSDARGNIKGRYSYNNEAGAHDLSYVAGENTGFLAVSGSLAIPNGLTDKAQTSLSRGYNDNPPTSSGNDVLPSTPLISNTINADGSYSYGYSTPDATQQQSGDANGNVKGTFSYRNPAGAHDLSYTAGSDKGFLVTGGSLSQPNGLGVQTPYSLPISQIPNSGALNKASISSLTPADASYRFEYSTDDSSRREESDASGNVQGSFSYRNQAGNHDLSYVAGTATGFQVTGGSLSVPNGLGNSNSTITTNSLQQGELANTGDASYSFTIDTDDYKRTEAADANGNVQGTYTYRNSAGTHDLSFIAGSATGFKPTGGSLSTPNTIPISSQGLSSNINNQENIGDTSYKFSIDTDDYKRTESSDSSGNVIGRFSYKNSAGNHDLSYEAGAEKGFRATGGSLSNPPGLTENHLRSGESLQTYAGISTYNQPLTAPLSPSGKTSYDIGNIVVNSYLPPSNEKRKFGYIFDTKH